MVLYTTDAHGEKTSHNLLGLSGNPIATRIYGDEDLYYTYNKDSKGSTTSLVNQPGSSVVTYTYTDFGETEIFGDAGFYNEICYTGGIYDSSTGLYYLNARYYNPEDGRFITQDTYRGEATKPLTWHLYLYCANNPVNFMDPSGHEISTVFLSGSLAYIVGGTMCICINVNDYGDINITGVLEANIKIAMSGPSWSVGVTKAGGNTMPKAGDWSFWVGAAVGANGGIVIGDNTISWEAGVAINNTGIGAAFRMTTVGSKTLRLLGKKFKKFKYKKTYKIFKIKITVLKRKNRRYVEVIPNKGDIKVVIFPKKIKIKRK